MFLSTSNIFFIWINIYFKKKIPNLDDVRLLVAIDEFSSYVFFLYAFTVLEYQNNTKFHSFNYIIFSFCLSFVVFFMLLNIKLSFGVIFTKKKTRIKSSPEIDRDEK